MDSAPVHHSLHQGLRYDASQTWTQFWGLVQVVITPHTESGVSSGLWLDHRLSNPHVVHVDYYLVSHLRMACSTAYISLIVCPWGELERAHQWEPWVPNKWEHESPNMPPIPFNPLVSVYMCRWLVLAPGSGCHSIPYVYWPPMNFQCCHMQGYALFVKSDGNVIEKLIKPWMNMCHGGLLVHRISKPISSWSSCNVQHLHTFHSSRTPLR